MTKQIKIGLIAASAAVVLAAVLTAANKGTTATEVRDTKPDGSIKVTDGEKAWYKEMIGNDMNIKKAVLILFDTDMECREFITKYGDAEKPQDSGLGMVPYMENGYYNIVGKAELEAVFDSLPDGGYSKEPVAFSGMFCYLKRISEEKPLEDSKTLEDIIRRDKSQKDGELK